MSFISYHASHEQFSPKNLLTLVQLAEKAGFTAANSSDHFHPWSEKQGQSGYAFSWLGAAMQATTFPFGIVNAPGQRYHPAIVAQAAATLLQMFPGRLWLALGSGEALNEVITGEKWPTKAERNARLLECVEIIRRLFKGETVTHQGRVIVEGAKLYTLPSNAPLIMGAAVSKETAEWLGTWADGLLTVSQDLVKLKEVIQAFRRGGGDGKPMYVKVQISYATNEEEALNGAYEQWRTNVFSGSTLEDLQTVAQFDAAAKLVTVEQVKKMVHISSDLEKHIEWIRQYQDLGFTNIIVHNVNRGQVRFIEDFGEKVIPRI